jgi:two-component system, cell cycle sensor histidine kinase and response regulator CckA
MLYYYIPVAYTLINLLIAAVILLKLKSNLLISRFYAFCIACLTLLVVIGYLLQQPLDNGLRFSLGAIEVFLYSMLPFFFLHFIVVFSRRYDILTEKHVLFVIYAAGLFGYAMMLKKYLPLPFYPSGEIAPAGYIYYAVWMSIFFSIGVALLHTLTDSFSEKGIKSNLFLGSFVALFLILPGPFAQSFYSVILRRGVEWYFVSSTAGLVVAVYLVFRHKIVIGSSIDVINAALAGMTDVLIKTDDVFRIQLVRGGVTPLLGYAQSDLVGHLLPEFMDEPFSFERYRQEVLHGAKHDRVFEADFLRKNGERLMVDLSVSPIIIDHEHAGFVCLGRNVTERRLVENSPDAMILYRDGKIVFGNTAAVTLLGFTNADQIIGKSILDFIPKDYRHILSEEELRRREDGDANSPAEGKLFKLDGTELEVEITCNPHHFREAQGIQLTIRDISERKRAERILKQSESFHRQVIENAAGVPFQLMFGPAIGMGYYKYVGEGIEELLGIPPAEFTESKFGSLVQDVIPLNSEIPTDPVECRSKIMRGELKQYNADIKLRTDAGQVKWVNDSSLPLRDEATGKVVGAYGILMDISDRKRTEKTLRESEERFRRLTESTFEGIAIHKDGILLEVNDSLGRLFGRSRLELIGKSLLEFTAPESRDLVVEQISSGSEKPYEATVILKDGTRITVELFGRKGYYDGQEVRISAVRDITERKRAQRVQEAVYSIAQAAETSKTLDKLFRRVHEIIQTVMPAKNFYLALYDSEEDILSFPYFVDEVDEPSKPKKPGRGLTEYVLRTGKSLLCDEETDRRLRENGEIELVGAQSPVWLGVPLTVDEKTIGVMVVQHYSDPKAYGEGEKQILEFVSSEVARAIDGKRTEEKLRESEERFRRLVELSPDSIAVHSEGKIVFVNTAAVKLMGASNASELEGKPVRNFVHPEYWGVVEGRVNRMSKKAEDVPLIEEKFIRLDGTVIDVEVAAIPFTFEGKPAIQVVIRNVSERKQLEEQFRQAQKMEGIGTLAGGIAHDFNNVLSIILAYTTFITKRNPTPEKVMESLATIEKAVQRGAGLVRQLLTFARKADIQLDYLSLNDVIMEIRNLLQETLAKTITFSLQLDERVPKILADHNQLHQALLNLCVNSRDAMGKGGVLSFETKAVPRSAIHDKFSNATEEWYVRLSVADTGEGMSEDTRKRIFEPFFTTKEKGKGTGLGLAVVYGVINNHHGFIDVESAIGKGTTFYLYFPVPAEILDAVEIGGVSVESASGGNETVLLVEDEELLLDLLKSTFEMKGYTALIARDGEEAVDMYRKHQKEIALVLSDIGLPKMGGYDEFLAIKKINPHVKVIFASGYLDPDLRVQMLKAGVHDFIQKPYESDEVLKKVRVVLDKK